MALARLEVCFDKVETKAHRHHSSSEKITMIPDWSLGRIEKVFGRGNGTPRHLTLREYLDSFILPHIEGTAYGTQKEIAEDMLTSHSEWTATSVMNAGDWGKHSMKLQVHQHLKLQYDDHRIPGDAGKGAEFVIPRFGPNRMVSIGILENDKLVRELCGRSFDELPEHVRKSAAIYIPPKGTIWQVSIGGRYLPLHITGKIQDATEQWRASRGYLAPVSEDGERLRAGQDAAPPRKGPGMAMPDAAQAYRFG